MVAESMNVNKLVIGWFTVLVCVQSTIHDNEKDGRMSFYHNSLSPKVVLRTPVNKFYLLRWFLEVSHLTEGVSVRKG